jgi:hypothetical protein
VSVPAPEGVTGGGGVTLTHAGAAAEIPGAVFVPGAAAEDIRPTEQDTIADAECYFPAGTPVSLGDQVSYSGVTYRVSGMPQTWTSPWTGLQGPIRVQLRR